MISAPKHQILAPAGGYWRNFVNTDVSIISNQIHLYGASFMISIRRLYHSINWFIFFPFTLEIRSLYHCINWKSGLRPRPSPYPFMFTLDIRCLYHCINWRSDPRGLTPRRCPFTLDTRCLYQCINWKFRSPGAHPDYLRFAYDAHTIAVIYQMISSARPDHSCLTYGSYIAA